MNKRRITAREVLADVRTGASDPALMEKYRLSAQGLQSVFQKLLKAGVLTREELDERVPMSERTVDLGLFICPACGNIQGKEFSKCPRCGFVSPHAPKEADEKGVNKSAALLKKARKQQKAGTSAAADSADTDAAEPFEGQETAAMPRPGLIKGYCQTMGIVSMVAYVVLVVGLFVILAVSAQPEYPSMTQLMVGVLAVALTGLVLLFLVLVTLKALNEVTGLVGKFEEVLFREPSSDEE